MDAQPIAQAATWLNGDTVKHGYPPPRLSAGSITTAYCGAEIVVEGAVSDRPPRDACPLCALAWQSGKRSGRRWARAFRGLTSGRQHGRGAGVDDQAQGPGAREAKEPDTDLS